MTDQERESVHAHGHNASSARSRVLSGCRPPRLSADGPNSLGSATGKPVAFASRRPVKSYRCPKIDPKAARERYESGESVTDIASAFGVTEDGIRYHAWKEGWRRPRRAWAVEARRLFACGITCAEIAGRVGVAEATVMTLAAAEQWERQSQPCATCGEVIALSANQKRARRRVCSKCRTARYQLKSAARTKAQKQEDRRRAAEKAGKTYRTREEWLALRPVRPRSPFSELGRYRHCGETPNTLDGARLVLRDTLTELLKQRCAAEGITVDTAKYRMWYQNDPAFRAKEKAKAAGRKSRRDATMRRDGTLTPDVVRRLFATSSVCPYCDRLMTRDQKTLDHLTPVSHGGVHGLSNVTVCCQSCNSRKYNLPFGEWLKRLPAHIAVRFSKERAA